VLNKIKPALADGSFVICDRFFDSSLAYQGFARGLDLELMQSIKTLTIDGFQPDITFLIDIEPSLALERIQKFRSDNNHYDAMGINFHNSVRNGFFRTC
jgi:dTMP kinase